MADVIVNRLSSGRHNVVHLTENDTRLVCNFSKESALVGRQAEDLLFSFNDGATVTLENFYGAYSQLNMPEFLMAGQAFSGKAFFAELPHRLLPGAPRPSLQSHVVLPESGAVWSYTADHDNTALDISESDNAYIYETDEEDIISYLSTSDICDAYGICDDFNICDDYHLTSLTDQPTEQNTEQNTCQNTDSDTSQQDAETQYTLRSVNCIVIPPSKRIYAPYRASYLASPDVTAGTAEYVRTASYLSAMLAFLATFSDVPESVTSDTEHWETTSKGIYVDMAPLAENFEDFNEFPDIMPDAFHDGFHDASDDVMSESMASAVLAEFGVHDTHYTDGLFDTADASQLPSFLPTSFSDAVGQDAFAINPHATFTYDTGDALMDDGVGIDMIQSVMTNMGDTVTKFVAKTVNGVEIIVFGNKITGDTVEATLQQIGGIKATDDRLEINTDLGWQETATHSYKGSQYTEYLYRAKASGANENDDDITILVAQNTLALGA